MNYDELPKPETIISLLRGQLLDNDGTVRDRGLAAGLRRLLLNHPQQHAHGLMALGHADLGECASSEVHKTVIGLFALHPQHEARREFNFGASCLKLTKRDPDKKKDRQQDKDDEAKADPFDEHFRRLITSRTGDSAAAYAARIVRRLKTAGVAVNYVQLLKDLLWWNDGVRENWVCSYFHTAEPTATAVHE